MHQIMIVTKATLGSCRVKTKKTWIKVNTAKQPVSIYFMRKDGYTLELNVSKDGFSDSVFNDICKLTATISKPVE